MGWRYNDELMVSEKGLVIGVSEWTWVLAGSIWLCRSRLFQLHARFVDGSLEETLPHDRVTPLTEARVHHLLVLIYRPVQARPATVQAAVCLVYSPLTTCSLPMRTRRLRKEWQESLHPMVDRATFHRGSALGEPLHHIGIAEE